MALKAGRVGVAPDQVDEFGKINSEATEGYTKQEADAKFETQTNASTEYAKLQPKTLAVPISMLEGSLLVPKTTVEDVLQTMNNAMTNEELTEKVTPIKLTQSDDMNNIFEDGDYWFETSKPSNIAEPVNNSWGKIRVIHAEGSTPYQIQYGNVAIYTRRYGGSPQAWGSWYKYAGTAMS